MEDAVDAPEAEAVVEEAEFAGPWLDYMVDVETGGLHPDACPMIQLAIVRFSLEGKAIHSIFKMSLLEDLPGRRWDASTQDWWSSMPDVYQKIVAVAAPSRTVMEEAVNFVCRDGAGPYTRRFWAKPTHFDWAFFNSYLTQLGLMSPFHFREATDVNSYIRGRGHWDGKAFWANVAPVGDAHDALNDCLYQIRGLFNA
jgi:hypothetical protein